MATRSAPTAEQAQFSANMQQFVGPPFAVHDLQDRGPGFTLVDAALLPSAATTTDTINDGVKAKYVPAYISIEEVPRGSTEFNSNPSLAFDLSSGSPEILSTFPGINDLAGHQDMAGADGQFYWYTLLAVADTSYGERDSSGLTTNTAVHWLLDTLSSVYVETIRRVVASSNHARNDLNFMNNVYDLLNRNIAHEIGHNGGAYIINSEALTHDEGGIMDPFVRGSEFTAMTLARFRSAWFWSQRK